MDGSATLFLIVPLFEYTMPPMPLVDRAYPVLVQLSIVPLFEYAIP